MFQEALQKWTSRTQQDANSLRMENAVDQPFAKSMAERDPTPALGWYNALRSKTKPIKVNAEWLKQVPQVDDRRPGPSLEKIPALKSQAPKPEPAAAPQPEPAPAAPDQPEKPKD